MIDPFERGKAWFLYKRLEREFVRTTSFVALETVHCNVWSEKYGDLLVRIGDMVDSYFRLMIDSKSLDNETTIKNLRKAMQKNRKKNPKWFPDICDFRKTFDSIFQLSSVEIEADYGLTYYGKLQPFKDFDKQNPLWWEPYNKVKHEIFEQIEKKATLGNVIDALAALFTLNVLHKENQRYLIRYTNTIFAEYLRKEDIEKYLGASFIGCANNTKAFKFIAKTQLFTHLFRVDPDPNKKA
jgi:hypothetical protein